MQCTFSVHSLQNGTSFPRSPIFSLDSVREGTYVSLQRWTFWLVSLFIFLPIVSATPENVVTPLRPLSFLLQELLEGVDSIGPALLPIGASLHHHEPTYSQRVRLRAAKLVVWFGPEIERGYTDAIQALPEARVLQLSAEGPLRAWVLEKSQQTSKSEMGLAPKKSPDWHLWCSSQAALLIAPILCQRLTGLYPQHQAKLQENLSAFSQRMENFSRAWKAKSRGAPQGRYGTLHRGFDHLADELGLLRPENCSALAHSELTFRNRLAWKRRFAQGDFKLLCLERNHPCLFAEQLAKQHSIAFVYLDTLGETPQLLPSSSAFEATPVPYTNWLNHLAETLWVHLQGSEGPSKADHWTAGGDDEPEAFKPSQTTNA